MDEIEQVGEGAKLDALKTGLKTLKQHKGTIRKLAEAGIGIAQATGKIDKGKADAIKSVTALLGDGVRGRGAVSRATLVNNASRRGRGELNNPTGMKELTAGLVGNYSIAPTTRLTF